MLRALLIVLLLVLLLVLLWLVLLLLLLASLQRSCYLLLPLLACRTFCSVHKSSNHWHLWCT
jgi:hypothetical protein